MLSLKRKVIGLIKLIRPINGFMMSLAVFVGAWLSLIESPSPDILNKILLGAVTAFTLSGASMAINDYCDYEIDKINEPDRPLPSGIITLRGGLALAATLALIGLMAAIFTSMPTALLALISLIVSVTYAVKGKRTGLPGNFLVSFCVAVPFIYGSLIAKNGLDFKVLLFSLLAFLSNVGREVTKGIVDISGDEAQNMRTVAVVYGERSAAHLAGLFFLSAVLLSLAPPLMNMVSIWFIPLVAVADAGFIFSSIMLIQRPTRRNARKTKNLVLIWMMFGMLAFLAGK